MDERSIEFLKNTMDVLAAMPQVVSMGAQVVGLVMEAKDVLDSGTVTDEQWDAQSKRIFDLRKQLHDPN